MLSTMKRGLLVGSVRGSSRHSSARRPWPPADTVMRSSASALTQRAPEACSCTSAVPAARASASGLRRARLRRPRLRRARLRRPRNARPRPGRARHARRPRRRSARRRGPEDDGGVPRHPGGRPPGRPQGRQDARPGGDGEGQDAGRADRGAHGRGEEQPRRSGRCRLAHAEAGRRGARAASPTGSPTSSTTGLRFRPRRGPARSTRPRPISA